MPGVRHLAVEATKLLQEKRGIGRYVRSLLLEFRRLDPALRITLYARPGDVDALRASLAALFRESPAHDLVLPIDALHATPADVVWYPWNAIRHPAERAPMVVTVHDVAPMLQLDGRWWKYYKRFRHARLFRQALERATRVIAISDFTAGEIRRHLGVDERLLRVVPNGADDLSRTATGPAETLTRLGIDGPFFLSVGAHDARKNLGVLYRAMTVLHVNGVNVPLVQCGPSVAADRDGATHPWLRAAGFVSDAELALLYRRATALVFPSLYEGFGLPVAEAMSAGGCVICANASSLPEVGGEAALYFEPHDADALARQMMRLLQEPGLCERLVVLGGVQARKFTWERCARATMAVFEDAVADARRA